MEEQAGKIEKLVAAAFGDLIKEIKIAQSSSKTAVSTEAPVPTTPPATKKAPAQKAIPAHRLTQSRALFPANRRSTSDSSSSSSRAEKVAADDIAGHADEARAGKRKRQPTAKFAEAPLEDKSLQMIAPSQAKPGNEQEASTPSSVDKTESGRPKRQVSKAPSGMFKS